MICMSDYILASSAEKVRLQLQARVWQPAAEELLDLISVQSGWHCLDLGCGAMGILGPLSRCVGPSGHVIGVDLDDSLLAAAREHVRDEGLSNVELLKRDVTNTGLPHNSFDLVHERFVLPYVSPEKTIEEMIALAKPGGTVAVQEPDQHAWYFYPESAKWPRVIEIIEAAFGLRGDINIGRQTFSLMRKAGLRDVQVRAAAVALPPQHPYMRMPIIGVNAMRRRIVEAGISTDAELDDLMAEVERLASDPETFQITFITTQVWGRKM